MATPSLMLTLTPMAMTTPTLMPNDFGVDYNDGVEVHVDSDDNDEADVAGDRLWHR